MKNSIHARLGFAAVLLAAASSPIHAEDCAAPCLSYDISTELEGIWFFKTNPSVNESSDIGPAIDAEFAFMPVDHLKLVSDIITEPVFDLLPGEDRVFSAIGTYVNEFYAEFDFDPVTLRWGKFEPEFGLATRSLDGIFATDLVGNYDNEERWGAQGSFKFEAMGLSHALTASAFTTDRTFLSESLFTNRGRARLSDGGAGNAGGIASVAAVVDGCKGAETSDCYADGKFGYRLGLRHQKAGHPTPEQIDDGITPRDEMAFLAASTARFEFDDMILRYLGELTYIENFDGAPDDAWISTVSASLESGPMTYMAAYSRQRNLLAGEPDTTEHLVDLTAAYGFGEEYSLAGEKWTLAAAYAYNRNADGVTAHVAGVTVTIDFDGTIGGSDKSAGGGSEE